MRRDADAEAAEFAAPSSALLSAKWSNDTPTHAVIVALPIAVTSNSLCTCTLCKVENHDVLLYVAQMLICLLEDYDVLL